MMGWVWILYTIAFESALRKTAMIVTLYKGKREKNQCKNYRGISLVTVVKKICA